MLIQEAIKLSDEVVAKLAPACYCDVDNKPIIKVCGSTRRQCPVVHDIDIVLMAEPATLQYALGEMGGVLKQNGLKIKRVIYKNTSIDIYIATPETWSTLVLIRTGSKEHNKKLCYLAQQKGWKLHAGGEGLFDETGKRIAGETEESIFEALGLPYKVPQYRN